MNNEAAAEPGLLPPRFANWFRSRGWTPRSHQLELLAHVRAGRSVLLVAPTGGGKTLAGFLPSLVDQRLIMPAFGAYSGGLNVRDPAISDLFGAGPFSAWLIGRTAIFPVARHVLR